MKSGHHDPQLRPRRNRDLIAVAPTVLREELEGAWRVQVAKIAASMAKFEWTVSCLVADDSEQIAGHGCVVAATQSG